MKKIKKCIIGYRRKENYSMKKSMIYRVLIYIAGLLILAMESYRRLRIVFTEVSDLRRTVLMCST